MEYDKIKQLMEDMGNSKLTSLDIDFPDGTKIRMKKEEITVIEKEQNHVNVVEDVAGKRSVDEVNSKEDSKQIDNSKIIKSPMVGTFYLKPSPTSDPYVEVGKNINVGDTVCIIEAMKLMNEIESDISGKLIEIIAKDGEPVEYGSPLFRVE